LKQHKPRERFLEIPQLKNLKMFRLVVLSAFVAVAIAAPSHVHESPAIVSYSAPVLQKTIISQPTVQLHEKSVLKSDISYVDTPTVSHVGNLVKSVPTAVSHQSSTVVHNKADIVEPILSHGVQRSIIETPRIEKTLVASPAIQKTVVESPAYTTYAAAAPAISYSAAAPAISYSAPLTYAAASPLAYSSQLSYASPLSYSAPLSYAASPLTLKAAPALAYASHYGGAQLAYNAW